MEVNVTKVMILLQRRYNSLREAGRLTKELEEAIARNDEVSTIMLLQMRAEELTKVDKCMEEMWQMGEAGREAYEKLTALITSDPGRSVGENQEEEKVYEIRRRTQIILEELRQADQRLNRKLAGKKSYYNAKELAGKKYESIVI
mgnify:CR=1 FL=1